MANPVMYMEGFTGVDGEHNEPGWYFWDETWTNAYGPYKDEAEANTKCAEYAKQL